MKLRILRGRSRRKLSRERWRGRSRRFTIVQSAVEALWNQGLALRMSLPEDGADDDRSHATLGQWRSFVGLFLRENVCPGRVPDEFDLAEAAETADAAGDATGDERDEPGDDTDAAHAAGRAPAAVYDVCLLALAATAHDLDDADVLAAPLPLHAAAETCGCPIERVLAIKVRGIPRVG